MIRRSVREWDYLHLEEPGPGAFGRIEADRIIEFASSVKFAGAEAERILVNHPRKLRAQQVVGVIAAQGVSLEILPKIDGADSDAATRKSLVHMLAAVLDLEIAAGSLTELDWQRHDLLEILIRLFCDRLFQAVHRGLPRRYVSHEDDLPALRGRLNIQRQFTTLAASPQILACRHDEFSPDIALNQIMKAAVGKLARIASASENQRRLAELTFGLADISNVPVASLPWSEVVIDRTNQAWSDLLALAKLLLGDRFQTTSAGPGQGFALLFEMNTLFEEFIGRMTQRALRGSGFDVRLQGVRDFALVDTASGKARFATKPDISVRAGGETLVILDTKWKRLKGAIDDPKQGVSQADVYQMIAYSHVYRCQRLTLLYPHHAALNAEPGTVSTHFIRGTENSRLSVATISLVNPADTVRQLRHIFDSGLSMGDFASFAA